MNSKKRKGVATISNWVNVIVVVLMVFTIVIGPKLPYLHTAFSYRLRMYYLCPALICTYVYLVFLYRKPGHETSVFLTQLKSFKSLREKIKATFLLLCSMGFLFPLGSLASIGFPASATELFARTPFVHSYKIERIRGWGGPVWTHMNDLHLRDQTESGEVVLPLTQPTYKEFSWKVGDTICLHGRTWIFGTIIDSETRDLTGC